MADAPATRMHVLQPHHVLIAGVLRFTHAPGYVFTDLFLLELYKLIMREISEIYLPLPYRDFYRKIQEFDKVNKSVFAGDIEYLASYMDDFVKQMVHPDFLRKTYDQLDGLIWERDMNSIGVFERRSYFGLFIRRTRLSIQKLSFEGAIKLIEDFQAWANGTHFDVHGFETNETPRHLLSFPTTDDELPHGTADAFVEFEAAEHVGDLTTAIDSLRRFFSQRFSEEADSGFNQYALLRMASTYYVHNQMKAAKDAIEEAMRICRNTADRYTLLSCTALQRRISAFYPDHEPAPLRKGFKQLEVLWDLRRSLESGEPVSKCWKFLWHASAGAKDLSDGGKARDRSNLASASAFMWKLSGIACLGKLWEDISLLNMDENAEDTRLTNILWRTTSFVRKGKYDEAWSAMIDPSTWRPLSLQQAQQWQWELWSHLHTFAVRTERKSLADYLRRTFPPYPTQQNYKTKVTYYEKGDVGALKCLAIANDHLDKRDYLHALSPTLTAATLTEYGCNWPMHRLSIMMIADLGIALGMAPSGQRLVEEHLPQILRGDDLEHRAYGCFTLARCVIANAQGSGEKLEEAVSWLEHAYADYEEIDHLRMMQQVSYVLAVVYENINMRDKRDEVSAQLVMLNAEVKRRHAEDIEQRYLDLIELSGDILVYVASGGKNAADEESGQSGRKEESDEISMSTIPEYESQ